MAEPTLKQLAESGLADIPLVLRPLSTQSATTAVLDQQGNIVVDGTNFSDPTQAMKAIIGDDATNSTGWQFWGWFNAAREAWVPLEHLRAEWDSRQHSSDVKTSTTHPLRIDFVVPIPGAGKIGMTFCPGKHGKGLYGGEWRRDLGQDLQAIVDWGGAAVVSLMESHEFALLGVPQFETGICQSSLAWYHLPIRDMSVPTDQFEMLWQKHAAELYSLLRTGKSLVIHCRGGLGRTGMIAARMLVEMGESPLEAVKRVRTARERAIETFDQEQYVMQQRWKVV